MKESREESLQNQQDQKFALTIRRLLASSDQNLNVYWQDREFLFEFPMLAVWLVGSEGKKEFSQDQRTDLFDRSLNTFLHNNYQILAGYSFTKDGKFATRDNKGSLKTVSNNPELVPQDQATDSATKALIGSILLIGMSLSDRERLKSLVIESYQDLSEHRRVNLTDTLGRLLAKNNATRTWIKENELDRGNGFDWDHELAQLLFFGIYSGQGLERFPMPHEMNRDLKHFSLQTRSVMLDFALEYREKLGRSKNNAQLTDFILGMDEMETTEDIAHKLGLLKQKASFKTTIA